MAWPQIIYLAFAALGLLVAANQHEKPRTGRGNFWVNLTGTAVGFGLLYWGGFFAVWGW